MPTLRNILPGVLLAAAFSSCKAQPSPGNSHLLPVKEIPMPGVRGRIDHLDVNLRDSLVYVAALGNNSLEIISLAGGRVIRSINGLSEPQGVAYLPQYEEIAVANGGNGDIVFYDARSFEKKAVVPLGNDADDLRYDSADGRLYAGYGSGGIAVIAAAGHKKLADIPLPAHPEGFQADRVIGKLFVNLPGNHSIAVIDLQRMALSGTWKATGRSNFPMAVDTARHVVFIGYRSPAKLVALNEKTGAKIGEAPIVDDADDLYADSRSGLLFASGGGGYISVLKEDGHGLAPVGSLSCRSGARTSFYIPQWHLFLLAERAGAGREASLQVYKTDSH